MESRDGENQEVSTLKICEQVVRHFLFLFKH
jgi:hypothetical protein